MKTFEKQPERYDSPEELIDWLVWDLYQQRLKIMNEKNKTYFSSSFYNENYENESLKTIIDDRELTLNIGSSNKKITITITITIDFREILISLGNEEDEYGNIICPYIVNFTDVTFTQNADFTNVTFTKDVKFLSSIFNQKADFDSSIFNQKADFYWSTFSGETYFYNSTFSGETYFYNSTFSGVANFDGSTFSGDTYFYWSTFSKNANFFYSTFSGKIDFLGFKFSGKVNFNAIKFKENEKKDEISIKFDNIKLENNSYISFDRINYDDEKNEFTESENSKIEIINTVIEGRIEFSNVKIGYIDFKGSDILGSGILNRINFEAEPVNWQTAVFLKNEAIKRSNTIEALKYKGTEKYLYTKYLKDKKEKYLESIKETSDFPLMRYYSERFSLWISKVSNDHGQNWIWAVAFTLISGFLFFSLSYLFISKVNIYNIKYMFTETFIKNYFNYLIPTNFELIKNVRENINILFYVLYIAGKISVGYGIFEIIQAFRKFNSKG